MINRSIWLICTLTSITTPGQSEPGSKGNERALHIPENSRTEDSPLEGLVSYPGQTLVRGWGLILR